jgi:hypothetical protein
MIHRQLSPSAAREVSTGRKTLEVMAIQEHRNPKNNQKVSKIPKRE